ncbi:type III polyketide synthase [Sphingomonas sp. A2-49]|uniref:type III polyketide synthase n=1 Tax=Sphingomonas sp. A2-49 TaxID=1391375 RepID=UPI0021D25862|nr:type III polyketide synthase [Sphingomonas sp. A2-49]MCU6455963.1 type III polyketide synthase [Sphingomonas sp. A2-49]
MTVYINRIGTAKPDHEISGAFITWAERQLTEPRDIVLLRRMAARSGIDKRWSVLPVAPGGGSPIDTGGFYSGATLPTTSVRMAAYAKEAPNLALDAVAQLGELGNVTHLVVASCTGFTAPGIDQIIANRLGLAGSIERTLVGFMGCYAAVAALRVANHIVRSTRGARVLLVTVELPTLHLQPDTALEPILAQMLWSDGAAAALVSAEPRGLALGSFFAATLPDSQELMRWTIGDMGFAMHLSGEVPRRIAQAVAHDDALKSEIGLPEVIDGWAIHAGGRSVLDAVESGLHLAPDALRHSRRMLAENGNMSSSTIMFVLAAMMEEGAPQHGLAIAFGPGLAAEGFHFRKPVKSSSRPSPAKRRKSRLSRLADHFVQPRDHDPELAHSHVVPRRTPSGR